MRKSLNDFIDCFSRSLKMYRKLLRNLSTCMLMIFMHVSHAQDGTKTLLFAGSYTDGKAGEGIHVYELDSDGSLNELYVQDDVINSFFLAVTPNGKYLYSVTESKLETDGSVSAFQVDSVSGKLSFLNKQTTHGRNPVHLNVHDRGRFVVSANYTDAVVNVYECTENGSLMPSSQFIQFTGSSVISPNQDAAHAHAGDGFDGFNLSDIFEYLDPQTCEGVFTDLVNCARPGARFAYWNMLVPRRRDGALADRLRPLDGVARGLHARDRAFFYRDFVVEEIV